MSSQERLLVIEMGAFLFVLALTFTSGSAKSVSVEITSPIVDDLLRINPKPCSYSLSGRWANTTELSVSPYPPKENQPLKVYLKFTALDDVWFGNFRGNVTRLEDKWVYSFDKPVCSSRGPCPIRRGETRVFNETFPSPSMFLRSGTYRVWAVATNQDDYVIYEFTLHDCPL